MLKILLAEDDKGSSDLFRWVIKQQAHELETVPSRARAFDLLQAQEFDVAIVDVRLSDGVAFDVIQACLDNNITVIAISANDTYHHDAQQYGARQFLTKPIRPDTLRDTLAQYTKVNAKTS